MPGVHPNNTAPVGRRSVSTSPNREDVPDVHSSSSARAVPEDSVFYDVFSKLDAQQGRQSAHKPNKRNVAEEYEDDEDIVLARDSTLAMRRDEKERRRREFVGEDPTIASGIEVKAPPASTVLLPPNTSSNLLPWLKPLTLAAMASPTDEVSPCPPHYQPTVLVGDL